MGCKPFCKMSIKERAKQFMPFSPLKGLEDAIAAQEAKITKRPRATISPDHEENLNRKLQEVCSGEEIAITHYEKGAYTTTYGEVDEINIPKQYFKVKGKIVMFCDIFDVVKI